MMPLSVAGRPVVACSCMLAGPICRVQGPAHHKCIHTQGRLHQDRSSQHGHRPEHGNKQIPQMHMRSCRASRCCSTRPGSQCRCSWAKSRAMCVLLIEVIQMASKLDANGCKLIISEEGHMFKQTSVHELHALPELVPDHDCLCGPGVIRLIKPE
ncbi:hypothetical protein BC831DRAFT_247549 [Entophlyctis helioformis]|nr:hypothetical protein BC831DRAFT_247549 [Entophlyctis helioformis]